MQNTMVKFIFFEKKMENSEIWILIIPFLRYLP